MNIFIKKVFNLSDIRYSWLLFVSMLLFIFSLYYNKMNPKLSIIVELITYGGAAGLAIVWGILNYIDHIKINAKFKKYDNVDLFVENLVMNQEEKEDLKAYLNDFVDDLQQKGRTEDEAIKTAIAQFQIQEFALLSKNNGIFELPSHYYLLGYFCIIAVAIVVIGVFTNTIFGNSFLLKAMNFTLNLYAIGLICLLFLYKLIDKLIGEKIIR